jgi:hypothetical protein
MDTEIFSMRLSLVAAVVVLLSGARFARADDNAPNVFQMEQFMPQLRSYIGKSLLSATVDLVNNTSGLSLESLVPQGAAFSNGSKQEGKTVDDLRANGTVTLAVTTCAGATSLDAKVSKVSVWEDLPAPQPNSSDPDKRAQAALGLQQMLEAMQDPPSVQTPGMLRAASDGFHGVTFDYTKGDETETLSFVNEDANGPADSLKINWSATDTAVCPANNGP